MNRQSFLLSLRIEQLADGRYLARSSRLPGLNVQGSSLEEVVRLAPKVARALISAMRSKGVRLPDRLATSKSPLRLQVLVRA